MTGWALDRRTIKVKEKVGKTITIITGQLWVVRSFNPLGVCSLSKVNPLMYIP